MPHPNLTQPTAPVRDTVVVALVVATVMLSEVLSYWPSRFVEGFLFSTPVRGTSPLALKLGDWLLDRRIKALEWDMKVLDARRQRREAARVKVPPSMPAPPAP